MKRREFLRGAVAAPLGAKVAAEEMALRYAGVTGVGAAFGGQDYAPMAESIGISDGPAKFTSFAKWLAAGGEREIKERAYTVNTIDPDILCLNLPLCTKIQWQRDRNLKNERERMEVRFLREFERDGFFKWFF